MDFKQKQKIDKIHSFHWFIVYKVNPIEIYYQRCLSVTKKKMRSDWRKKNAPPNGWQIVFLFAPFSEILAQSYLYLAF